MEKSGIDEALEIDSLRCGLCGRAYGAREPTAIGWTSDDQFVRACRMCLNKIATVRFLRIENVPREVSEEEHQRMRCAHPLTSRFQREGCRNDFNEDLWGGIFSALPKDPEESIRGGA